MTEIRVRIEMPSRPKIGVSIEKGLPKLLQSKTVTPTTQQQTVTPDSGFYGLNEVTVNAAPTQPLVVTPSKAQQIINPDSGYVGFEEVTVEAVTLQDKTVTPTEQVQVVEADDGYDGLNQVTVNPPAYPDLSWIMEAKVGNHPVVTAADIAKIKDYIAEDNGAFGLLSYAEGVTSIDFGDVDEVGAWALGQFARNIPTLTSATFPALETINKERALYYTFANSGVQSVIFPILNSVSGSYVMYQTFYNCIALTSISFPALTSVSGTYAMYQMLYGCTGLTSVSFPNLTSVNGSYAMASAMYDCRFSDTFELVFPNLETITGSYAFSEFHRYKAGQGLHGPKIVRFPKLKTIGGGDYIMSSAFYENQKIEEFDFSAIESVSGYSTFNAFNRFNPALRTLRWGKAVLTNVSPQNGSTFGFINVENLYIHPSALQNKSINYNVASWVVNVTQLELTADASTNLYLSWQGSLTAASVKNVLERCNNSNMNGKTVTFYSSGLTVTDDAEGSLQTLKDAVTAQGCTINNLTINPYTP